MSISVYYNSGLLFPTPVVSSDVKFIDYNAYRHGNIIDISLNGTITGINSTGNVSQITNLFSPQFQTLEVYENGLSKLIYSWPFIIVDSIDFSQSHYASGTSLPYSIKLKSYNVPSGITNPSNKYDFQLNEDLTVTVKHDISAEGVKNISGSLSNVINFVKSFTGKQPFSDCSSFFIPGGSGVLMNISERIDRMNSSYSISETWKYNTGSNQTYVKISSLNISDLLDNNYLTLEYDVKFQGSPVNNNLDFLGSGVRTFNVLNDISDLGIDTSNLIQSSSDINRESGNASLSLKISYLSGYNNNDLIDVRNRDFYEFN